MAKTWALLLIIPLLASTLHRELGIAYYYAFRDYVSQELCKNLDQPELECNGKCFLNEKVLAENKKDSTQDPPPVLRIVQLDLQWLFHQQENLNNFNNSSTAHFFTYFNFYQFLPSKELLHPPWWLN